MGAWLQKILHACNCCAARSLWVLDSLLSSEYKPRVVTAEFNTNIPWPDAISFPDKAKFDVRYQVDRVHYGLNGVDRPAPHGCYVGASAAAFDIVAKEHGYEIVAVVLPLDLVMVRSDLLGPGTRLAIQKSSVLQPFLFESPSIQRALRDTRQLNTWMSRAMTAEQAVELVDYRVWRNSMLTGIATMSEAVTLARKSAREKVVAYAWRGNISCFRNLRRGVQAEAARRDAS